MSDTETSNGDIRIAIQRTVQSAERAERDEIVETVAALEGVSADRVNQQIDSAEKNGLLYLVNGEVRLP